MTTDIAALTAKLLIEIKAVHFNAAEPYTFTSGWKSPVYVDCRRIVAFPRARRAVIDMAVETILRDIGFEAVDVVAEGARTLLVEDLATDAKSKVNFVNALRTAGQVCTDAFVVFHYGIFPQSKTTMDGLGVKLHALATWWDVLAAAKKHQYFDAETLREVESFLGDPVPWSAARGGATG